jgi:hypothetical protein
MSWLKSIAIVVLKAYLTVCLSLVIVTAVIGWFLLIGKDALIDQMNFVALVSLGICSFVQAVIKVRDEITK